MASTGIGGMAPKLLEPRIRGDNLTYLPEAPRPAMPRFRSSLGWPSR